MQEGYGNIENTTLQEAPLPLHLTVEWESLCGFVQSFKIKKAFQIK